MGGWVVRERTRCRAEQEAAAIKEGRTWGGGTRARPPNSATTVAPDASGGAWVAVAGGAEGNLGNGVICIIFG